MSRNKMHDWMYAIAFWRHIGRHGLTLPYLGSLRAYMSGEDYNDTEVSKKYAALIHKEMQEFETYYSPTLATRVDSKGKQFTYVSITARAVFLRAFKCHLIHELVFAYHEAGRITDRNPYHPLLIDAEGNEAISPVKQLECYNWKGVSKSRNGSSWGWGKCDKTDTDFFEGVESLMKEGRT